MKRFSRRAPDDSPDKTALVCRNQRLTYRQIEQQSNQLAHGLIAMGVRRGHRVAVYLDNSVEAVVSIFAILKAGAAFVMVSPGTKIDKLLYILNNSAATVLITTARKAAAIQSRCEETHELASVLVTGDGAENLDHGVKPVHSWESVLAEYADRIQPPSKEAIDADMAALIYTSGSTGIPKAWSSLT